MNKYFTRRAIGIFIIILVILALFVRQRSGEKQGFWTADKKVKGFRSNRIYLTRHAQCRMDCRHISEEEIKEILSGGNINYDKSDPDARPCPKYAVDGVTHEGQRVRILVGDCKTQASVITVIDLENEYKCDCK